jgi:polysaccharide biosynthesis transport protein
MTPQPDDVPNQAHERHAWRVRFHSRLNRFKNLLRSKWWIPVIGTSLGACGGAALWFFPMPHYVSVGRMMMSMKLMLPEGSLYTEELSNFLGTQMALMQSGSVQSRAQARLGTQGLSAPLEPVLLKANVLPKTTIFVLQATGSEPQYTQAFLDACMEEYIDLKREMRTQTSETTLAGLTEELLRLQKELRKYDEEMADFQSSNSVVLFQEQGNSAGNYLSMLNQRLAALRSEYDLLQTLTLEQDLDRRQQTSSALPTAEELLSRSGQPKLDASELDYLKAKQQILLLKADRDEMAQYLKTKHPKMIALSEEIARRERLLEIFRQQGADQLETRKNSLALQLKNIEKDIAEWDSKTLQISRKNAAYQKLKANSQRSQALYDRLLATMQTLDVNKEISPESVNVVERASTAQPDRPNLARQILLGILAGLGPAAVILLIVDRLDDRMNSFAELQDLFDEDVLGQVPWDETLAQARNGSGSCLVLPDDQRHALLEAYRNLRSSFLYMSNGQPRPKVFLVTSSVPGEGKSMTAANLALTLANAGSRVLLVDADLRKGVLHSRFGVAAEPGLSSVLVEGVNWRTPVQSIRFPNFSFLPRGPVTHRSSELFVSPATKNFIQDAAPNYDFIVLDTAPVMAADDVTSMAPLVDGTVFVVRAEYTSARVARAALDALYQRQAAVLGLVFNAVRPSTVDYYYYKYQDYYAVYPAART